MLKPFDYILDADDNFWIISYHYDSKIYGKIIYHCDPSSTKFNFITGKRYRKDPGLEMEIPTDYKMEFHPREFFQSNKNNLVDVWLRYVQALNQSGISDEDIGIFGSYLIGFDVKKDIDFVIYGNENLHKYHAKRDFIGEYTQTSYITEDHIQYQLNKYSHLYHPNCDLLTILRRNWSGIQVGPGVLSTPRFLDEPSISIPLETGKNKLLRCQVVSGIESANFPRKAKVSIQDKIYDVVTPFWMMQSFAKEGDVLELFGDINDTEQTILLMNKEHWIRYLNA